MRLTLSTLTLARSSVLFAGTSLGQVTEQVTPYMLRKDPQEFVLTSRITLVPNLTGLKQDGSLTVDEEFKVEQGTLFFPLCESSSSHDREMDSVTATLRFDRYEVPIKQALISTNSGREPLHSGETYGSWQFEDLTIGTNMLFTVESRVTCWNTVFDEDAAIHVQWPTGDWPKVAASTFEPELFINEGFEGIYETDFVARLSEHWIKGKAKSQPPMVAAKWLAGQVARDFQPNRSSVVPDARPSTARQAGMSVGAIGSFEVVGAEAAAERRKGSSFDMAILLTAVYREVGLPARLVVGYVGGANGGSDEPFRAIDRAEIGPYAWVEVALYDENQARPDQQLTWVPVDIFRIREDRVYAKQFDQPWPGFGSSEQLNEIIPIAFHLHPHRVGAISYGGSVRRREPRPALWGWNVVPQTPSGSDQAINFSVTAPSRGPGEPEPGQRRRGQ